MGKSLVGLIIVLCFFNSALAQDSLCVFEVYGTVLKTFSNSQKTLSKGGLIKSKESLQVLQKSQITAIDNKGNVYFINEEGSYSFNELLNFYQKKQNSGLTANYLKYIWLELLNKSAGQTMIAGVFRGEVLMQFPKNKTKLASSKITLKWDLEIDEPYYYVFVKNLTTGESVKFETNGSELSLYADNLIFNESNKFEWSVTTQAFPNVNNIPFFGFELIDREAYIENLQQYNAFINDLISLGISDKEIESILCQTYNLCN
ncbi:hypothetical protein SAMN06265371_10793 [Lutibacter agarilyticus]|uniref:GLPGLI family protein n=1 Tax=Lutibacter agarilyticus TaxID=1109740 RepID=A0A238XWK2_9FLAO|nr:hypothetical protein [Lutibacter agarilyticus]SNR62948.1 hypothetical protein SAMN06265371_10793 [Lutibacter agarilyticus]